VTQLRRLSTCCLTFALLMISGVMWSEPQGVYPTGAYTAAEFDMYMASKSPKNPADQIGLLNAFVATYPMSSLLPFAYIDLFRAHFAEKNYPKAIEYADRFVLLDGKADLNTTLAALLTHAQAFQLGCSDPLLQTPEAYKAAIDAAEQGRQALSQLLKAPQLSKEGVANLKRSFVMNFDSATQIAEAGLKGDKGTCIGLQREAMLVQPPNAR
jgi:hypothetical protein